MLLNFVCNRSPDLRGSALEAEWKLSVSKWDRYQTWCLNYQRSRWAPPLAELESVAWAVTTGLNAHCDAAWLLRLTASLLDQSDKSDIMDTCNACSLFFLYIVISPSWPKRTSTAVLACEHNTRTIRITEKLRCWQRFTGLEQGLEVRYVLVRHQNSYMLAVRLSGKKKYPSITLWTF